MNHPTDDGTTDDKSRAAGEHNSQPQPVTPRTLFAYLAGNREAICAIANWRHAVPVGALLVLSAGLAREYDGEDLRHEPWHLLIPHAASLATSLLLYGMVWLVAWRRSSLESLAGGYGAFLGLFWMTAPLAWLYAVPFERWVSPGAATAWNLRLLGVVSLWRVILIMRAIRIAYGAERLADVIFTVLLFGDLVMLAALSFVPVPILQVMGGVRLTDTESILQGTVLLLQLVGFPALVILCAAFTRSPPQCASVARRFGPHAAHVGLVDLGLRRRRRPGLGAVSPRATVGTTPATARGAGLCGGRYCRSVATHVGTGS